MSPRPGPARAGRSAGAPGPGPNPRLAALYRRHGQSLWLDQVDRDLLWRGGLESLVRAGVRGVTTNPTLFHDSIAKSHDYDDSIRELIRADPEIDAAGLYHWLVLEDVQRAAEILRPLHDASEGLDGYVSVELAPFLAHDAAATEAAALHLWRQIGRPNVMIKVPGTPAGLRALEGLTGQGVSINVTLLFSVSRYREVVDAWLRGIARCPEPGRVASVASFFLSRIDAYVDARLARAAPAGNGAPVGLTAIACARRAFREFERSFHGPGFEQQRQRGARAQRLLWASTGTKRADERDTRYVEALIGPETVVTVPARTLSAFLDHGEIGPTLGRDLDAADHRLERLAELGIDLEHVAAELEADGLRRFTESYDATLALLERRRRALAQGFASG